MKNKIQKLALVTLTMTSLLSQIGCGQFMSGCGSLLSGTYESVIQNSNLENDIFVKAEGSQQCYEGMTSSGEFIYTLQFGDYRFTTGDFILNEKADRLAQQLINYDSNLTYEIIINCQPLSVTNQLDQIRNCTLEIFGFEEGTMPSDDQLILQVDFTLQLEE
jgi:hypothetical protein